jgi:hypothetical protein
MSFIVFAFTTLPAHSQKMRFTDSTNLWVTKWTYNSGTTLEYHAFNGSAIFNGVQYVKLVPFLGGEFFVREDTMAGKVYFKKHLTDTMEYVAYDYNLQVGDTIMPRTKTGSIQKYTVASIDSVLIQSVHHKVWYFNVVTWPATVQWLTVIEGVGELHGPTFTFHLPDQFFDGYYDLVCFSTHNTTPPLSKKVGMLDNISSCVLSVDNNPRQLASGIVFPNPISSSSSLRIEGPGKSQLFIWNVLGQEVYTTEIEGMNSIPIGKHIQQPGIYYYKFVGCFASGMDLFTGSFIRE